MRPRVGGRSNAGARHSRSAVLDPIRTRYEELRSDEPQLHALLARGAEKAGEVSAPTLEQMYERMGFARP